MWKNKADHRRLSVCKHKLDRPPSVGLHRWDADPSGGISRTPAGSSANQSFLDRLYGGSEKPFLATFIRSECLSPDDMAPLRARLGR